jgi:hypothetical protein
MVTKENELKKECNCRMLDVTFTIALNFVSLSRVPGMKLSASEPSKMLLFSSEDCKTIDETHSVQYTSSKSRLKTDKHDLQLCS